MWRDRLAAFLGSTLGLATRQGLDELRDKMEAFMDETVDELWEKAGARASAIMAELNSLRASDRQKTDALAAAQVALADQQSGEAERTRAAVADALGLQTAKDIERLRGLVSALGDEIPVDVPPTPDTPAAGEPAQIPDTPSGVDVPPVDEGALPTTDPQTGETTGGVADGPDGEVAPVVDTAQQ